MATPWGHITHAPWGQSSRGWSPALLRSVFSRRKVRMATRLLISAVKSGLFLITGKSLPGIKLACPGLYGRGAAEMLGFCSSSWGLPDPAGWPWRCPKDTRPSPAHPRRLAEAPLRKTKQKLLWAGGNPENDGSNPLPRCCSSFSPTLEAYKYPWDFICTHRFLLRVNHFG